MWIALWLALMLLTPTRVTDLVAREGATRTGIQWRLTIPALNDSATFTDEYGETQCPRPHRYVSATDSVTYHWRVLYLPPPYRWPEVEDSLRVARNDTLSQFYQTHAVKWRREGNLTQHWLSRTTGLPQHYLPGCSRNLYLLIREYP